MGGSEHSIDDADVDDVVDIHRTLILPIDPNDVDAERSKLRDRLQKKDSVALMFVADSLGLHGAFSDSTARIRKKLRYVDALVEWVSKSSGSDCRLSSHVLLQ